MNAINQRYALINPQARKNTYFYVSLMEAMFTLVGVDRHRYTKSFGVCRDLCNATNVFNTTEWKNWEGLKSFMAVIERIDRQTQDSNLIHCPSAPELMAAIAVEQVMLRGRLGHNKISDFFKKFDCYNKAASAVFYFQKGNREDILVLNQPWDLTASVQRPPKRLIPQFEPTTSSIAVVLKSKAAKDATRLGKQRNTIKIESSPEYEAESSVEHQAASRVRQEAGPHAMTQLEPLHDDPTISYDANQVDPNTLHRAAFHAKPQAGQPATDQFITPFGHQNTSVLARQAVELREKGREEPMATSMPGNDPSTKKEVYLQVARADVMECLQPLFGRLKYEDWTGSVQHDIMRILTEQSIKVITAEAKGMLGLWAGRVNNGTVLSWLEKAHEDLTIFQWIEKNEKPATMMWYRDHINAMFHDIDATIGEVLEPAVRNKIRAQVYALRDVIFAKN